MVHRIKCFYILLLKVCDHQCYNISKKLRLQVNIEKNKDIDVNELYQKKESPVSVKHQELVCTVYNSNVILDSLFIFNVAGSVALTIKFCTIYQGRGKRLQPMIAFYCELYNN